MNANNTAQDMITDVTNHINQFEQETTQVQLSSFSNPEEIYKDLLRCIIPVDFDSLANNPDGKARENDKIVICIDQLLELSDTNNRAIQINIGGYVSMYNGKYWQLLNPEETKIFLGAVAEKMGLTHCSANFFKFKEKLYKQLISHAYKTEQKKKGVSYVNFQNGTLIIDHRSRKNTFQEHKSIHGLRYCLPYDYNQNADCPKFKMFLDEMLPDKDAQLLLMEHIGRPFVKDDINLEKILFLYGDGLNGKSVIYNVVCGLLGEENVTHYSLESVTRNKDYCRAKLHYKLLNYGSDINDKMDVDIFKKMASQEMVEARDIYRTSIEMRDYATQIYNTNVFLDTTVELTDGFERRIDILLFQKRVEKHKIDTRLAEKLAKEYAGIFNLALEGILRLMTNSCFTECQASEVFKREFFNEANPIMDFLHTKGYTPAPIAGVTLHSLYNEFKTFCEENCLPLLTNNMFSRQLRRRNIRVEKDGSKPRVVFVQKIK